MKRIAPVLLLWLCLSMLITGCAGLTDSASERQRRHAQINRTQMRMLVDDWDYLWLYDRGSRMSEWHTRVGR